jgi:hypothetical protein
VFDGLARDGAPFGTKITCECGLRGALRIKRLLKLPRRGLGGVGCGASVDSRGWVRGAGLSVKRVASDERRSLSELDPLSLSGAAASVIDLISQRAIGAVGGRSCGR